MSIFEESWIFWSNFPVPKYILIVLILAAHELHIIAEVERERKRGQDLDVRLKKGLIQSESQHKFLMKETDFDTSNYLIDPDTPSLKSPATIEKFGIDNHYLLQRILHDVTVEKVVCIHIFLSKIL